MSISERIRPGIEAAEWVCVEVAKLETSYEALRQRVKEWGELQKTYNDYYRRKHHPRCDLLEAAGTDSLCNQCTCQQCIEEDVLAAERAISDKLEKALKDSRETLQRENDEFPSAIKDTIWHTEHETLFDFMDSAIAELAAMRKGETE